MAKKEDLLYCSGCDSLIGQCHDNTGVKSVNPVLAEVFQEKVDGFPQIEIEKYLVNVLDRHCEENKMQDIFIISEAFLDKQNPP